MKIGILTYHRTLNYGACLQSIATRVLLERMGHDAYYVDYWPEYHKRMYNVVNWYNFVHGSLFGNIKYLLRLAKCYSTRKTKRNQWQAFVDKAIVPYCRPVDETYDVVLYGSDQIWRKQKALNGNYNEVYFGKNEIPTKAHVAFSASMGQLPSTDKDKKTLKELFCNFDAISVRESNLRLLLLELGYEEAIQTLDPTLLIDQNLWNKTIPTPVYTGSKYVLYFPLRGGFRKDDVMAFAKEKGLDFKELRPYTPGIDVGKEKYVGTPEDFLYLIKNAEYVFTSSFHGLAFSIIYGKQVFASFNRNGERAISLLSILGIQDHYVNNKTSLLNIKDIDYNKVNPILTDLQKGTLDFLSNLKVRKNVK